MIETKIKEVESKEVFPSLYQQGKREIIILANRQLDDGNYEGIVVHPKSKFGEYSVTFSPTKYSRMSNGSELTMKFIQE